MNARKKVEIVTATVELWKVCDLIERQGVSGYTVIRDVMGKGQRGIRAGDQPTDIFKNSYWMVICSDEMVPRLEAALQPILKRFGGVFVVTDCMSTGD